MWTLAETSRKKWQEDVGEKTITEMEKEHQIEIAFGQNKKGRYILHIQVKNKVHFIFFKQIQTAIDIS